MNTIEEIKSRIDIVDLVSETVKLRRAGKNYTGFCPFHANTRTPAFVVFPESGTWRCFGECNEGGDIFRFIMKKEGWDFPETLRYLAQKAGITLEPLTPKKKEEDEYVEKLRGILEDALIFFRHNLTQTEDGSEAFHYLTEKRSLNAKTIETFELGYAPNAWEKGIDHFKDRGFSEKELVDCGLITKRSESDGYYDRFRNRVVFPIRDAGQRLCGFGARALLNEDMPKYLNSPQTLLFDKSALLYGLDKARKPIRSDDQAVIVEGYFDVIGLHQAGFKNAVSPMGTALTPIQMRLLKGYTRKIILALDPDTAGEKATMKGLEVARETMDHSADFVFDPKGLIRTEARLDADIRVCSLPDGLDPDEIALDSPEQWQTIITKAKPIITHVIDTLTEGKNLEDPKTKSEIAAQVVPLIKDVPNPVERDTYRQQLARILHVDEHSLFSLSETQYISKRSTKRRTTTTEPAAIETLLTSEKTKVYNLEKHVVLLLLREPEMIYELDRYLSKHELPDLDSSDFQSGDLRAALDVILKSIQQVDQDIDEYIQDHLAQEVNWLNDELRQLIPEGITPDRILEDLAHTLLTLRRIRIIEKVNNLLIIQESNGDDSTRVSDPNVQSELLTSIKMRAKLEKALSVPYIND
ncbi:MAG TPA: DNA primase [Anaerolineaceae bacterium]|uniref:DNA primase n=1 Tax=Anaerolinea thermophila TaxID=167964 RepID=A0A101FYD9_9CHLR|nr:MAG: DNA primase [Anaerolinea thermophila]HAF60851.1 DNA primase [Anaerolineaceae bacterium]